MNKGKYVFSQLLSFLDPFVFLRISKKYCGDKYVKTFSCWNQLAVMMFGQLSNRESLRELVSVSLTDTVELKTLFCKPNCNIVNELNDSSEPTLF